MAKSEWVRATKGHPCLICGKTRFCSRTSDGAIAKCMWIASDWPDKGKLGGWIHRLNGQPIDYTPPKPKPKLTSGEWRQIAKKAFYHDKSPALRAQLAEELGVGAEALFKLRVGRGFDDWRGLFYSTWPQFDYNRQVTGIVRTI
jgi:hypothetical protein